MFKFSYVQSVAGKATVVDKDTFKKIITDTRVKAICNQIASTADTDAISRLKRGLPAFCWHAWFDDGKRKNYTASSLGTTTSTLTCRAPTTRDSSSFTPRKDVTPYARLTTRTPCFSMPRCMTTGR